jgi:hypothetical protein
MKIAKNTLFLIIIKNFDRSFIFDLKANRTRQDKEEKKNDLHFHTIF